MPRSAPPRAAAAAAVAALAAVAGGAVALAAERLPATGSASLAAGAAACACLALVVLRPLVALAAAIALMAAVRVEPAPCDAVFALAIAAGVASGRSPLRAPPRPVGWLLATFVALGVLATADAVDVPRAAAYLSVTVYLVVLAVWLSATLRSAAVARLVASAYVGAAVASAVLGSLALLAPLPGGGVLLYGGSRVQGLFRDPNVLGAFLVPAALVLLEERRRPRLLRLGRRGTTLALLAVVVGVLLSYSRGAWLNLAAGVAAMLVVAGLRRGGGPAVRHGAAALLAGVAVVAAVVALSGSAGFLAERADLQAYDAERFANQRSVAALAVRHPAGIGPGQVEIVEPLSAHSTYVRALAEEGVTGLVVLLALLAATLGMAVRNVARGADTYGIGSAPLLGAWCGLLVNSAVIDTLHWRHLWLVAAVIWAGAARRARLGAGTG